MIALLPVAVTALLLGRSLPCCSISVHPRTFYFRGCDFVSASNSVFSTCGSPSFYYGTLSIRRACYELPAGCAWILSCPWSASWYRWHGYGPFPADGKKYHWWHGMLKYGEFVNTVVYDTIYAHQNLKDDLKAGVKSVAVACQGRTKLFLSFPSILEVGLLGAVGLLVANGSPILFKVQ